MSLVSVSNIVGAASKRCWSQVHDFTPAKSKISTHGILLMAIKVEALGGGEVDLASFGKEIIQRFHEHYYGTEVANVSLFSRLESAVSKVTSEFEEVAAEIAAGIVLPTNLAGKEAVLYLAVLGKAQVVLWRGERLYKILDKALSEKDDFRVKTASGFVQTKDVLVLGTGEFFKLVSSEKISSAMVADDSVEIASILAPQVHGSDESAGVAALVVKVAKEQEGLVPEDSSLQEPERKARELIRTRGIYGKVNDLLSKLRNLVGFGRRKANDKKELEFKKERDTPEIKVVGEAALKKRRLMLSVALVLLFMLASSVFFGWRRRVEQEKEQRFSEVWDLVEHKFSEAVSLVELNPIRARALLFESRTALKEAISESESLLSDEQLNRLRERLDEIESKYEEVSGQHSIQEADVFLDLSLVRDSTVGEYLGLHGDTLVVLDRSDGVLLRVDLVSKSSESVGGGHLLSGAKLAGVYSGRGFVVSDSGVVEVSLSGKTSAVVIGSDPEWGEIVDIDVFGGNLYLLDRGTHEIFRYQGVEGGFGTRQRWLGEGILPDLSGALSMAIDGEIWVLKSTEILRFSRGSPVGFRIVGLETALSDPIALYTDEDSERLYVLDRGNKRVVVLDKNGEYTEQYQWEGIESVSSMVVSESQGKIILLSGSLVYEIGLEG